jgi:hypothetical protein
VQRQIVQPLIQWMPLGGSSWLFFGFLLRQEWAQVLLTFPVTVVTAVWAAYSKNFVERLSEIYAGKGKQDADALSKWLDSLDQALKWQFSGFEAKYLRCQGLDCQDYKPEGMEQRSGIFTPMLREVFVPLKLSGDALIAGFRPDLLNAEAGEDQEKQPGLLIWDLLCKVRQEPAYRQMAILAWGGYGKTTLLKHIAFSYAEGNYRKYRAPKLVPVLLYLRKWRKVLSQENPPSLSELITQQHIPDLPGSQRLKVPPNWAVNLLEAGRALVMLDGFDEVADHERKAVSQWISAQMRQYSESVFLLSSRPGGYELYVGEKPRTALFVQAFNREQRQKFVRQWYLCQERYARGGRNTLDVEQQANRNAADLLEQIDRRQELRDMAKNPLILNMIATFHRTNPSAELPRRRAELYQEICTLQLRNRPNARNVELLLEADERQVVLQGLALEMMQRQLEQISKQELLPLLAQHLAQQDETVHPEDFLEQIVQVSELLVEREPEEYEFTHLSFQEYLAAAEVKRLRQEALLYPHLNEPFWYSTIRLYAAQIDPISLLRAALDQQYVHLAYDCWRDSTNTQRRRLNPALVNEITTARFQPLENMLTNAEWKAADRETYELMITTVGKEIGDIFSVDDILSFPCKELVTIDRLWVEHSNGKWGFSVQKQIWQEFGSPKTYNLEDWREFFDRVGWRRDNEFRRYENLSFDLPNSLVGELPSGGFSFLLKVLCVHLFSRAETCGL